MSDYNPSEAYLAWERIPVDDFGYISADELMNVNAHQLMQLVQMAVDSRTNKKGWRNWENKLVEFMGLGKVAGKTVMDFGCGLGLDAMQFAAAGAEVILADLHPKMLRVAQQVVCASLNINPKRLVITSPMAPFFTSEPVDLFWSFGVLHHTPFIKEMLKRACEILKPGGEIRIGLYSDKRWQEMMGESPPAATANHPRFMEFVRKCDTVGNYADWYNEEKIVKVVEGFAEVTECGYICKGQLIGVAMKRKE